VVDAKAGDAGLIPQPRHEPVSARSGEAHDAVHRKDRSLIDSLDRASRPTDLQVGLDLDETVSAILWLHEQRDMVPAVGFSPSDEHGQGNAEREGRRWLTGQHNLACLSPAPPHDVEQPIVSLGMVREHECFDLWHLKFLLVFTDVYGEYTL
jgi:hypothetical protein